MDEQTKERKDAKMTKATLQVYDPPMCCPSGVCGVEADPELTRFAGDLGWLKRQGVEVERFSLSSDPQAFVRHQAVKEVLHKEGNDCLPLIFLNGTIVSKGMYPTRSELAKFCGIEGDQATAEAMAMASSVERSDAPSVCGPGCACETPVGGKRMKVALSLLVLLAVVGIFVYKATTAQDSSADTTNPRGSEAFAFAPPPATPSSAESQPADAATPAAATPTAATPTAEKAGRKVGKYLNSLSDLNKVAINQDAVFVFIPARKSNLADDKTNTAMHAAQQALKRSNITLGLYTLPANSPDYSGISAQIQTPAILVACKGKGMAAVSGDVTETKLLQAFMASSRAGGCGPSGCGPSGCN